MPHNFSHRVDRKNKLDEAKRRFVARVSDDIFQDLFSASLPSFKRVFATTLGKHYTSAMSALEEYIHPSFEGTLQGLEAFYRAYSIRFPTDVEGLDALNAQICALLAESDVDLGVRWHQGHFMRFETTFLDHSLTDEVLLWLQETHEQNVLEPYKRGLRQFLHAEQDPEALAHVVIDMYASFEAFVTQTTGADLSTNQELFLDMVHVSAPYKNVLQEYVKYAHACRHAVQTEKTPPSLSLQEVESFIYLTGVFLRLAMTTVSSPP
jgi:hypothetical protein